jgi:hypothetical protein
MGMSVRLWLALLWYPVMGVIAVKCLQFKRGRGWLIGPVQFLGASMNQLAVWSNGMRMPLHPSFWRPTTDTGTYRMLDSRSNLPWLCDVLWSGMSLGDLFLVLPILWLVSSIFWDVFRAWKARRMAIWS